MTNEEAEAAWETTPPEKRHHPTFLAEMCWRRKNRSLSVKQFISIARTLAQSPRLDEPTTAAAAAADLMYQLCPLFARLVETGKLDDALPEIPALPILYAPTAGTGSRQWVRACELFKGKRIGATCRLPYIEHDNAFARDSKWRHLAYDTVWLIQRAARDLPMFRWLRERSAPYFSVSKRKSTSSKKRFGLALFRVGDDELLGWPDWLDTCALIPKRELEGVPVKVPEALGAYEKAAEDVLTNFFADPHHPFGEELIAKVIGGVDKKGGYKPTRTEAVEEARTRVIEAIARIKS